MPLSFPLMLSTHLCLKWCEAEKADGPLVMNTVATKRFVWSECFIKNNIRCQIAKQSTKKVVNKHSKWPSEGGNKVACVEQTNNYYAPEPQTTVCGKIPLSMRCASLALRTLTCSTLVSHQQSSHYWLIREDQFGPMLLKYLLPKYFLYCSILLKEL